MTNAPPVSGWRTLTTRRLRGFVLLSALGVVVALVGRRPEALALVAPLIVALVLGLSRRPADGPAVALLSSEERAVEGDVVELVVGLGAVAEPGVAEVTLALPPSLHALDGPASTMIAVGGDPARAAFPVRCVQWGTCRAPGGQVRLLDPAGLVERRLVLPPGPPVKVHPYTDRLRRLVGPVDTQVFAGNRVARVRADGIEVAGARPFVPGDQVRRVNWRLTGRTGAPWVNEHHPERNADVVLFIDTFERGALLDAVRAASSLATAFLAERDRVGLVTFGGTVGWLRPGSGPAQLHRVLDVLMDAEVFESFAWKSVTAIPPRVLPPKALVLAITPLRDERVLAALADLRGRGIDVAAIELPPPELDREASGDEVLQLTLRLARLVRGALRARFATLGIAVVPWKGDRTMQDVMEELRQRRPRPAPAL